MRACPNRGRFRSGPGRQQGLVVGTGRQAVSIVRGESGEMEALTRREAVRGAAVRVKDAHTQVQTDTHTDTRGCAARRCE